MARHSDLYRLIQPLPDLRSADGRGPVLVHGLEGFSDAGQAIEGATEHLRDSLDSQLIVEFDADQLVDYRSRRPHLKYSFDHFASYDEPTIQIQAVKDADGEPLYTDQPVWAVRLTDRNDPLTSLLIYVDAETGDVVGAGQLSD